MKASLFKATRTTSRFGRVLLAAAAVSSLVSITGCGSSSSAAAAPAPAPAPSPSPAPVTGVATPSQISVVTAK
ncbi:MAG TPA: hypothetical protein VFR86_04390 [Burkholderiaceae bacterium]|nr:hypothetical protein [Burkholderiaceae bacterium]